jgi:hypothetical protein
MERRRIQDSDRCRNRCHNRCRIDRSSSLSLSRSLSTMIGTMIMTTIGEAVDGQASGAKDDQTVNMFKMGIVGHETRPRFQCGRSDPDVVGGNRRALACQLTDEDLVSRHTFISAILPGRSVRIPVCSARMSGTPQGSIGRQNGTNRASWSPGAGFPVPLRATRWRLGSYCDRTSLPSS